MERMFTLHMSQVTCHISYVTSHMPLLYLSKNNMSLCTWHNPFLSEYACKIMNWIDNYHQDLKLYLEMYICWVFLLKLTSYYYVSDVKTLYIKKKMFIQL